MALSSDRPESVERRAACLAGGDEALLQRFRAVRSFSRRVRASEYHITNACNLRCRGCWFFTFEFDRETKDQTDLARLRVLIERERARRINAALLIGGEPTLVPDRVMASPKAWSTSRSRPTGPALCRVPGLSAGVLASRSLG